MHIFEQKYNRQSWSMRQRAALLLALIILSLLAGCAALTKSNLEVYKSTELNVEVLKLPGWEVQVEQTSEGGIGFLTMKNDYSGILVTRAPMEQLFPAQADEVAIDAYLNMLVDISQGSFAATGPVEEQQRSGYQQATAPISMEQVADMSGTSDGTLLLAIQESEAVVAVFFCAVDQREKCEKDLASSVKGFMVLAP